METVISEPRDEQVDACSSPHPLIDYLIINYLKF